MITAESSIQDIANLYNALFDTAVEAKTLGKRGKAKVWAQIEQKAKDEGISPLLSETIQPLVEIGSLAKLREKIAADAAAKAAEELAAKGKDATPAAKTKKAGKAKAEKNTGPTIRSVAEELLAVVDYRDAEGRPYGLSYDAILKTIEEKFDGAKTTVACLRWYAVHMRERGERVPHRPRATPAKKVQEDVA